MFSLTRSSCRNDMIGLAWSLTFTKNPSPVPSGRLTLNTSSSSGVSSSVAAITLGSRVVRMNSSTSIVRELVKDALGGRLGKAPRIVIGR